MLIIITDKGEFQTKDSKESIIKQINNSTWEIKFKWPVSSIPLENGLHSCDEEITLNLDLVKILGFKEYVNIEKITTQFELDKLDEKIKEDSERAESLRKSLKDPDYIKIQELEAELKERKSTFSNKIKEASEK